MREYFLRIFTGVLIYTLPLQPLYQISVEYTCTLFKCWLCSALSLVYVNISTKLVYSTSSVQFPGGGCRIEAYFHRVDWFYVRHFQHMGFSVIFQPGNKFSNLGTKFRLLWGGVEERGLHVQGVGLMYKSVQSMYTMYRCMPDV